MHWTHLWLVGDEKAHVSKFNFSRGRPDDFPSHFDAARKNIKNMIPFVISTISLFYFLFLAQPSIHSVLICVGENIFRSY